MSLRERREVTRWSLADAGLPEDLPLAVAVTGEGKVRHLRLTERAVYGSPVPTMTWCHMFWSEKMLRSADRPEDLELPLCRICLRSSHATAMILGDGDE